MAAPNIPLKFIKTLPASGTLNGAEAGRFFIKLLYEFWGFCVNGGESLLVPGGFAAVSGVIAPAGFESGSTVLWAQGRDGLTDFGDNLFHSDTVNFINLNAAGGGTGSMGQLLGKHLVTWKPDSDSTDDSIYPIIGIVDANTIRVQTEVGGTRRLGNKAWFRKRSGISFRVIDIIAATKLAGWTDGAGVVAQFNKASVVNPGQANSQVKVSLRQGQVDVGLIISPSGSWNGLNFTDGTPEMRSPITLWFDGSAGFVNFLLIAGRDCILVNCRGIDGGLEAGGTGTSGFHVEIPKRLYTGSLDPNPVAYSIWGQVTPTQLGGPAGSYSNFHMVDESGTPRPMVTMVRCPWGQHIDTAVTAVSGGIWQNFSQTLATGRYINFNFNEWTDKFVTSDGVLASNTGGHFSLARARLRRVRFTSNNQFKGFRYGDIDWVFAANGVLWPWDNSMQGYGIQPEGV